MALYEYQCSNCSSKVEVIQSYDDPAPTCDKCSLTENTENTGSVMVRMLSKTSFILKGGNWYKDGYSSPGNNKK